jgi:hypothetical protein
MAFAWQDLTALGTVIAAVLYLVIRWRRRGSKGSAGCPGCGGCESAKAEKPLVQLDITAKNGLPFSDRS